MNTLPYQDDIRFICPNTCMLSWNFLFKNTTTLDIIGACIILWDFSQETMFIYNKHIQENTLKSPPFWELGMQCNAELI